MPLHIPTGFSEATFIHEHNDTLAKAVCTLGLNEDDPTNLLNVGNLWATDIMPEVNSIWTFIRFEAAIAGGTIVSDPRSDAGGGGGNAMTPQVSYLFRKNTVHPGRHGHGRMYLMGCDETSVDGSGKVSSGKQTGLQTAMDTFLSDMATLVAPILPVLLHYDTTSPYAISSIAIEPIVATQRRRLKR